MEGEKEDIRSNLTSRYKSTRIPVYALAGLLLRWLFCYYCFLKSGPRWQSPPSGGGFDFSRNQMSSSLVLLAPSPNEHPYLTTPWSDINRLREAAFLWRWRCKYTKRTTNPKVGIGSYSAGDEYIGMGIDDPSGDGGRAPDWERGGAEAGGPDAVYPPGSGRGSFHMMPMFIYMFGWLLFWQAPGPAGSTIDGAHHHPDQNGTLPPSPKATTAATTMDGFVVHEPQRPPSASSLFHVQLLWTMFDLMTALLLSESVYRIIATMESRGARPENNNRPVQSSTTNYNLDINAEDEYWRQWTADSEQQQTEDGVAKQSSAAWLARQRRRFAADFSFACYFLNPMLVFGCSALMHSLACLLNGLLAAAMCLMLAGSALWATLALALAIQINPYYSVLAIPLAIHFAGVRNGQQQQQKAQLLRRSSLNQKQQTAKNLLTMDGPTTMDINPEGPNSEGKKCVQSSTLDTDSEGNIAHNGDDEKTLDPSIASSTFAFGSPYYLLPPLLSVTGWTFAFYALNAILVLMNDDSPGGGGEGHHGGENNSEKSPDFWWQTTIWALASLRRRLSPLFRNTVGFFIRLPQDSDYADDGLTPNVGLHWYLFTELFDHFRPFFGAVFQLVAVVHVLPLSALLRESTALLWLVLLIQTAAFSPYPSLADAALYIPLLLAFPHLHRYLRYRLLVGCVLAGCALLIPVTWYVWLWTGTGNPNFYFSATWTFGLVGQAFLAMDLAGASLRHRVASGTSTSANDDKLLHSQMDNKCADQSSQVSGKNGHHNSPRAVPWSDQDTAGTSVSPGGNTAVRLVTVSPLPFSGWGRAYS